MPASSRSALSAPLHGSDAAAAVAVDAGSHPRTLSRAHCGFHAATRGCGLDEFGDSLADAVYAITDAIPFYDIGSARVVIEGVCDEMTGCPVPDEFDSTSDGASDGDEEPLPRSAHGLTWRTRNCTLKASPGASGAGGDEEHLLA